MAEPKTIQDVFAEYEQGLCSTGEIPLRLLEVLHGRDIDSELASLPAERTDGVLWKLRDHFAPIVGHEPASYVLLEGVTVIPGREEAYRLDLARREEHLRHALVPYIQGWLRDHPLPPRERFPSAIVAGLLARVTADRVMASRGLSKEQRRDFNAQRGFFELLELDRALETALRRASLGGVGSQEQAMAWEGVARSGPGLSTRADLTPDEARIVALARKAPG